MEGDIRVRKEESCGDRVQHGEAEIRRRFEFEKVQRAEERVTHHGDSTQYREGEILGVCRGVIYET